MRCPNCTTELWGNPEACPVCGTPTGLTPPRGRQARTRPSAAPEPAPPPQESGAFRRSGLLNPAAPDDWLTSQGTPLFNASDLIDPSVLGDIPLAGPESGPPSINAASPAAPGRTGDLQAAPVLNAADLFDPDVLADLSLGGVEEERGSDDASQDAGWLLDPIEEEEQPPTWQQPERQASGPIAPIFSLPPLAAPPTPPRPSAPIRSQPLPPDDDLEPVPGSGLVDESDEIEIRSERGWRVVSPSPPPEGPDVSVEPDELEMPSERGWRVVSPSPPPGRLRSRPVTRPHPAYPSAAYPPMPEPRAAPPRSRGRATRHHSSTWVLGGWLSLLLVLSIIGAAIAYGAIRYFQLEGSQANPAQASGPLPTVAPKAGYTIYRDTSLGFSLQYPSTWQEQADKDQHDAQYTGDIFKISFNAALEVGTSPQYQNWSPSQIDDYVLTNTPGITNVSSTSPSTPTDSTIPIAGLNWTPEDATVTLNNGLTLTMTSLAVTYNGRGYVIFFYANPQVFSNYDSQYFEPILLSFRFLNGGQ